MNAVINSVNLASILGVSNATVAGWVNCGRIKPVSTDDNYQYFNFETLDFPATKKNDQFNLGKRTFCKTFTRI